MGHFKVGVNRCAGRVLQAVNRPQRLCTVRSFVGVGKRLLAVRAGKRDVTGRMPILRKHNVVELLCQGIDRRHDLVAAGHGECAPQTCNG